MKEKISGIYKIQSKTFPDKFYIGSSNDLKNRIRVHKSQLKHNKHTSILLQRFVNKYGLSDLEFNIIEIIPNIDRKDLFKVEQRYLDKFNPPLNIAKIADGPGGFTHTEEAKKKIGAASKLRGRRKFTEEEKLKISKTKTGMAMSEETKEKMRQSHLGKKYKPMSEDGKKNISESQKGKTRSQEAIDKHKKTVSNFSIEKKEEIRAKLVEARKNISKETREKLRQSTKRYWENKKKMQLTNNQ